MITRHRPIRLTVVQTHPVQYYAPWFRHIAARCPELDLTVLYATAAENSSKRVAARSRSPDGRAAARGEASGDGSSISADSAPQMASTRDSARSASV